MVKEMIRKVEAFVSKQSGYISGFNNLFGNIEGDT